MKITVSPELVQGAVSFEFGDGWLRPWRLPFDDLGLFPSPDNGLVDRAGEPAGIRLRFRTDAKNIRLTVVPDDTPRRFDLTADNTLVDSVELAGKADTATFSGPGARHILEVWLSPKHVTRLVCLDLRDATTFDLPRDTRRRWITYGSSISHCREAHSPARTWPATTARELNLCLTCLGFSGQCHLDPLLGNVIGRLPADLITLKMGINVMGNGSLNRRSFMPAIIHLVRAIRAHQPLTPIVLVSPIYCPHRETTENSAGMHLTLMREHMQDAHARLSAHGDKHLFYLSGLDLLGEELGRTHLPDNLHPNGDGYEIMGRNAAQALRRLI